jgi:hypothetical protein
MTTCKWIIAASILLANSLPAQADMFESCDGYGGPAKSGGFLGLGVVGALIPGGSFKNFRPLTPYGTAEGGMSKSLQGKDQIKACSDLLDVPELQGNPARQASIMLTRAKGYLQSGNHLDAAKDATSVLALMPQTSDLLRRSVGWSARYITTLANIGAAVEKKDDAAKETAEDALEKLMMEHSFSPYVLGRTSEFFNISTEIASITSDTDVKDLTSMVLKAPAPGSKADIASQRLLDQLVRLDPAAMRERAERKADRNDFAGAAADLEWAQKLVPSRSDATNDREKKLLAENDVVLSSERAMMLALAGDVVKAGTLIADVKTRASTLVQQTVRVGPIWNSKKQQDYSAVNAGNRAETYLKLLDAVIAYKAGRNADAVAALKVLDEKSLPATRFVIIVLEAIQKITPIDQRTGILSMNFLNVRTNLLIQKRMQTQLANGTVLYSLQNIQQASHLMPLPLIETDSMLKDIQRGFPQPGSRSFNGSPTREGAATYIELDTQYIPRQMIDEAALFRAATIARSRASDRFIIIGRRDFTRSMVTTSAYGGFSTSRIIGFVTELEVVFLKTDETQPSFAGPPERAFVANDVLASLQRYAPVVASK